MNESKLRFFCHLPPQNHIKTISQFGGGCKTILYQNQNVYQRQKQQNSTFPYRH